MACSMVTVNKINSFKTSIVVFMNTAKNNKTQKDILSWRNESLECLIKSLPKKERTRILKSSLLAFSDGYYRATTENATIFLYNVNGNFYKTEKEKIDLPSWRELPEEYWPELGKHGGIYWRETLKPFHVQN